ncbi:DUF4345 domain-containing protein [Ichthyenterobacterium sp. W332]|uniref:DUF4345 domain-containing protein n=1 Tax=Microcosmobacter mediterraneus TaxID=3075607 RepID=A0ABU2YJD4_9FLAO|nr:DUF4345 domain-containing protein [Ichthyenterobacterium sp. W332]MDT0557996.1 DUF4345 domain-containing protein [Ichthyenterobacterium sp. W332]
MVSKNRNILTKIHLIISVLVVIPASIIYGFYPESILEISPDSVNERNFHKAIMGLYLGFSLLWLLGVFKIYFIKAALISNIVFMLGLGFGRLISVLLDGTPSFLYSLGTIGELLLGFYGVWVCNQYFTSKINMLK